MLTLITGNILESTAECLVNTVNCEGFMGKGIAYQFKKAFPKNNEDYVRACRTGELTVGKIHTFYENGKTIINFPTKDKWREKSQLWYIEKGMDELTNFIQAQNIKSIAIPPLGCGNGGLEWDEVQKIIFDRASKLDNKSMNIIVFAPTLKNVASNQISKAPNLSLSHLILMKYKLALSKFGKIRLQKTAYFMNLFMKKEYFNFKPQTFGPYAHSIEVLSKEIAEFQQYYKKNTEEAFEHAIKINISTKVKHELENVDDYIKKAVTLVDSYPNTNELELAATICYIIQKNIITSEKDIVEKVKSWSSRKNSLYAENAIVESLNNLKYKKLIIEDLLKYSLNFS